MNEPETQLTPEVEADLVALADGNLGRARRLEVEARVAAVPALAEALMQQRAALALLATAGAVSMPPALRARVAQLECTRRRRLRAWIPVFGAAMAAAAAAIALLVASGGPRVEDVVVAALRPATAEAAPREHVDGLAFPTYPRWRAVGVRADVVDGRATRTVFYERGGRRVAYTIVARPALAGGRRVVQVGGRRVVQWTRAGRTCLLSGDVDPGILWRLVASTAAG